MAEQEHELKFPATTAGDQAAAIRFNQLADDPKVYDLCEHVRGDGHVINYKTRD